MASNIVALGEFDATRFLRAWAQQANTSVQPWHALAWAHRPPQWASFTPPPELAAWLDPLMQASWGLLPGVHRLRLRAPANHPHPINANAVAHLTLGIGLAARAYADTPCTPVPDAALVDRSQRVAVLGGGLAGAACARALAERGFRVQVIDQSEAPAGGASGLPVGLVAPHASPDDSVISRLSRAGVRAMRDAMQTHLQLGIDWGDSGVQERRLPGKTRKGGAPAHWSTDWPQEGGDWTQAAPSPPWPANSLWHPRGAWVRPAALVRALLQHPSIEWRGGQAVTRLQRQSVDNAPSAPWRIWQGDAVLAQADQIVLATGPRTVGLLQASGVSTRDLPIRPLRGQMSWGRMADLTTSADDAMPANVSNALRQALPATPVNGHGSFVHSLATADGLAWFAGATFDRERDTPECLDADHQDNLARVQSLLPELAPFMANGFAPDKVRAWAGVRCSVPDRLPMVGALPDAPGLWVCSAMGSRGLTLAVLCAELLAAQWCGEPLAVEPALARAVSANRFTRDRRRDG